LAQASVATRNSNTVHSEGLGRYKYRELAHASVATCKAVSAADSVNSGTAALHRNSGKPVPRSTASLFQVPPNILIMPVPSSYACPPSCLVCWCDKPNFQPGSWQETLLDSAKSFKPKDGEREKEQGKGKEGRSLPDNVKARPAKPPPEWDSVEGL